MDIKMKKNKFKKYFPFFLMMTPGLLYLLVNNYIPMAGIIIAFKNYKFNTGILGSKWCGLSNFTYLFSTGDAWRITRNTILYNVAFIVLDMFLAVTIAIILNDVKHSVSKKIYQTMILFPYLISMVVVSYLVYGFLSPVSGFINNTLLASFGKDGIAWYSEPKYWPFILVFVQTWKSVGYSSVIYLASLTGIDPGYFEAAQLDGATKFQQIRYITLPCLKGTIVTMLLLQIGKIFYSDFGLFYQVPMNSGALYDVTSTIDTYVYRGLMESYNISMSAAAGVYQSVVGFILVLLANKVVSKFSEENALF